MAAALPNLTPCAEGFSEAQVGETIPFTICLPAAADDCPAGEHAFLDGCRAVGDACPTGRFADATGVASPIYVDSMAAAGGDGTEAAPFSTIADALAVATAGDTILLSMGVHAGGVTVGDGISLVGACATGTTIDSSPMGAIITTAGDDVRIENLRVTGDHFGVLANAGTATLAGVDVDGTASVGVVANGAELTLDDVSIHDTQPTDGSLGIGLVAMGAASHVSAQRLSLVRNATFSAGANVGSVIELSDTRIVDSQPPAPDGLGVAMSAIAGSRITCERCAIERAFGLAVDAGGMGSSVTLIDTIVDETLQATGGEESAFAVLARDASHVELHRTAVTHTAIAGVVLAAGSSGVLTDVVIHDTRIDVGLVGYARSTTTAERLAVNSASGVAVHYTDPSATVSFTDLTVVDTRARETDGLGGRGMEVSAGVDMTLTRAHFENVREVAMLIDQGATVTATDLRILNTIPNLGVGRGINVQGAASFVGERVEITGSSEVGFFAYSEGTTASLRDVEIADTLARDCPDDACLPGAGMGFVVFDKASLDATSFLLARNALAGLQLVDADVTWSAGVVRDHPIGVNIQLAPIDATTLTENVVYIDNGQNLDATALPTPAPAPSVSP